VPYQVKLDDGRLIFAPLDDDRVIRSSDAPPPAPPAEEIPDSEKLPVTVLTGFLGAGKTTLVSESCLCRRRDSRHLVCAAGV
jgi:hypothetical protein